jgi:beta-glucosidase
MEEEHSVASGNRGARRSGDPDARARELVGRMSLAEKIAQMNQPVPGWDLWRRDPAGRPVLTEVFHSVMEAGAVGGIYGTYRTDPWSGRRPETGLRRVEGRELLREMEEAVLSRCRVAVPPFLCEEATHGLMALGAPTYPCNLALAATWRPDIWESLGEDTAAALGEWGVSLGLVSLLDLLRDPRWSRCEETFGEDPRLVAEAVRRYARGFSRVGTTLGVGLVAKHLAGYGETLGGRNGGSTMLGPATFAGVHLPPVLAALEGGAVAFMAAYSDVDGVPCHANPSHAALVAAGGAVLVADCRGIDGLYETQGVARGYPEAAALACRTGRIALSLFDRAYGELGKAVSAGLLTEADIDPRVHEVLRLKYALGLFDREPFGRGKRYPVGVDVAGMEDRSREAARASVVLLQNAGQVLPLDAGGSVRRLAVIGPHGGSSRGYLGDYTVPRAEAEVETIADRLTAECGTRGVVVRAGRPGPVTRADAERLREAHALCEWADVTVLCLGTSSTREYTDRMTATGAVGAETEADMDCGEGVDAACLRLSGDQESLLEAARATGKPLILVLILGRPIVVPALGGRDALVVSWYPGPWGAAAIVEVLLGDRSPSGRLPVSLPITEGALPAYYDYRRGSVARYRGTGRAATYALGAGMGYADPRLVGGTVTPQPDGSVTARGTLDGGAPHTQEIVQLYVSLSGAVLVLPSHRLEGFCVVDLEAGGQTDFELQLGASAFDYADATGAMRRHTGPARVGIGLRGSVQVWHDVVVGSG